MLCRLTLKQCDFQLSCLARYLGYKSIVQMLDIPIPEFRNHSRPIRNCSDTLVKTFISNTYVICHLIACFFFYFNLISLL